MEDPRYGRNQGPNNPMDGIRRIGEVIQCLVRSIPVRQESYLKNKRLEKIISIGKVVSL